MNGRSGDRINPSQLLNIIFCTTFSRRSSWRDHGIPAHRQCFNVSGNCTKLLFNHLQIECTVFLFINATAVEKFISKLHLEVFSFQIAKKQTGTLLECASLYDLGPRLHALGFHYGGCPRGGQKFYQLFGRIRCF